MQDSSDFIDLKRIIEFLAKHVKWILTGALIFGSSAYLLTRLLPEEYRATATFLPQAPQKDGRYQVSETGGGILGGLLHLPGSSSKSETFLAILKSHELAFRVIRSQNLLENLLDIKVINHWALEPERLESMAASVLLKKRMRFFVEKELPVMVVEANFEQPDVAAKVANSYLAELQNFLNENSLGVSKRERKFLETQIKDLKWQALKSEKNLSEFFQNFPSSMGRLSVDRSLIGLGITDLDQLRSRPQGTRPSDSTNERIEGLPQKELFSFLKMENETIKQVLGLLQTQYQIARVEESKDELSFQILDRARTPLDPRFPNRLYFLIGGLLLGAFLGGLLKYLRGPKNLPD